MGGGDGGQEGGGWRGVDINRERETGRGTGQKHTYPPPWESTGYVLETY